VLALAAPLALLSGDADLLPALSDPPPSAQALGLWASSGNIVLAGPSPVASAHTDGGRAENEVAGVEASVAGADGSVLASVQGLRGEAVARADRWALQSRAFFQVTRASLLDGKVEASLLAPHVFSSNGARFETERSRVAEVRVLGIAVSVQGSDVAVPISSLGVLVINETVVDEATGTVTVNGLHLHLNSGVEVIVAQAQAQTSRGRGEGAGCLTWSEAYPVGTNDVVLSERLKARHNSVMGDVMGGGKSNGRLNDLPVENVLGLGFDAASATQVASVTPNGTVAQVWSEVAGLHVLNTFLTVDFLRGMATTTVTPGVSTTDNGTAATASDAGTVLLNVKVGSTVVTNPMVNQNLTLTVLGKTVGYVLLHEQTNVTRALEGGGMLAVMRVNMVHVVLTTDALGLKAGTQIVVGHAISISQCGGTGMPPMDFGDPLGVRPA
jgi:hypothetical protein